MRVFTRTLFPARTRNAALLTLAVALTGLMTATRADAGTVARTDATTPARAGSVAGILGPARVMVIVEENHTFGQIIGSPRAPYLNQLAARYGSATAMHAGYPTTCPSLAGYILMTSGATQGICDDKSPRHHPLTGNNIFAQVAAGGLTWRGYGEDEPANCYRHSSPDLVFLVRHTPAAYYRSEQGRCGRSQVPAGTRTAGALHDDITRGTLPAYSYVTPNACHDMHSAPSCTSGLVPAADAWLAGWMPQILAGPDFTAHRLVVIITWDEGSRTSNHIPTLVISASTRRLTSATPYTHCSTLATVEDLLRLPRLGCAATAASMRAAFAL